MRQSGDPDAAKIIIDFYCRLGAFDSMPENVRAFCRATARTNLRDWRSARTFAPRLEAFTVLDTPATLVCGRETPTPTLDVNRHLQANIPNARKIVVEGADHFPTAAHAAACAEIL